MKHDLINAFPNRCCALGKCPAFGLNSADVAYLLKANYMIKVLGMPEEQVIKECGVPSGECKITEREMVYNTPCSIPDSDFLDFFRRK